MDKQNKTGCTVIIIIFIAGAFMAIYFKTCFMDKPSTTSNKSSTSDSTRINRGDSVIIQSSDGSEIGVAITKEAYKDMHKYSIANDKVGLVNMIMAKTVFLVSSGTTGTMIDRGVYEYEIRLTSGNFAGDSVWIASDFVKKSP